MPIAKMAATYENRSTGIRMRGAPTELGRMRRYQRDTERQIPFRLLTPIAASRGREGVATVGPSPQWRE